MSRFVCIAALFLCMGYAAADGEGQADSSSPMSAMETIMLGLMKQMQSMNSPETCAKVCGDACALESSACVDIPQLVDCAATTSACTSRCDTDCACLGQCQATCGTLAACLAMGPGRMVACNIKTTACLGQCEGQCAANGLTQAANTNLKRMSAMMSAMIGQMMAMMPPPPNHM